jgi:hypothetical protein
METPLHPEKCMVWCTLSACGTFGPISLNNTVISDHHLIFSAKNLFLHGMGVNFEKNILFKRTGLGNTLGMQCWMDSMSILTTEYCLIVFLNGLDMDSPGHHTHQILTNTSISYGAF